MTFVRYLNFIKFNKNTFPASTIVGAQGVALVSRFALMKYIAVTLGVEAFGQFAILIAISAAVNTLALGPLSSWAVRYYQAGVSTGNLAGYRWTLWISLAILMLVSTIILVPVALGGVIYGELTEGITYKLVGLGIMIGFMTGANEIIVGVMNAAIRQKTAAILLAGPAILSVLGVVILVETGVTLISTISVAILATTILGTLISVVIAEKHLTRVIGNSSQAFDSTDSKKHIKTMVTYIWPFVIWGIASYAITFGDRWFLSVNFDAKTVGIYAAMATASIGLLNAVSSSTMRALEPHVYLLAEAEPTDQKSAANGLVRKIVWSSVLVLLPMTLVYALWPEFIIGIFTSSEFVEESRHLWMLFLGAGILLISQQMILRGLIAKRPRIYLIPKLLHGLILVCLFALLVPTAGINGVVWSLVISNSCQLIFVFIVNRRQFQ